MDEVITPIKLTDFHFDPINFLSFHILFCVFRSVESWFVVIQFDFSGIIFFDFSMLYWCLIG